MELWTEYEGITIDGAFPLTKLLRPEGRSAFFSTANGDGVQTVIRLIEAHFDEDEILARWRGVAALNHPNALKLEEYGQVVLDETSLVYAVMEPIDANLEEVLSGQRLSLPEARQLATSLVSVLETLHSHGFVHEHIEPANVFAVDEVVKLRSDCIREAPEGEAGRELKRRDVRDLAVVLLQALTQQRTLEAAARDLPLPVPFDAIVRKGMSGEWGAAEIATALEAGAAPQQITPAEGTAGASLNGIRTSSPTGATLLLEQKVTELPSQPASSSVSLDDSIDGGASRIRPKAMWIVIAGLAALLVVLLGWHSLHRQPVIPRNTESASTPENTMPKPAPSAPVTPAPAPPVRSSDMAAAHGQWRVIAFTYNHQDQAQHKVATMTQKHPELHPEVFTPTGRAPYLVAIGGAMGRDEAFALASRVRNEGLPRDTYAQNYSGKSR